MFREDHFHVGNVIATAFAAKFQFKIEFRINRASDKALRYGGVAHASTTSSSSCSSDRKPSAGKSPGCRLGRASTPVMWSRAPTTHIRHRQDDAALRAYAIDILTKLGYRVLDASCGAAALEILNRTPAVDLLFTDIVMPGKNGCQLAVEGGRSRPAPFGTHTYHPRPTVRGAQFEQRPSCGRTPRLSQTSIREAREPLLSSKVNSWQTASKAT